jgi:hypothetical protein
VAAHWSEYLPCFWHQECCWFELAISQPDVCFGLDTTQKRVDRLGGRFSERRQQSRIRLESFRTGVLSSEQAKTGALVACVFGADKKTVRAPMLSEAVAADSR